MGTPGQARNAQRRAEGALRRAEIMRLRASGMQPIAIAEQMQITPRSVARHIARALSEVVSAATEEYRALEAVRLDALIHAYWEKALDGDLPAAYFVSKIIGQRMSLFGLEQPPGREDDAGDKLALLLRRVAGVSAGLERNDHAPRMEQVSEGRAILQATVAATERPGWERALQAAYSDAGPLLPNE